MKLTVPTKSSVLKGVIRDEITSGKRSEGERIPGEHELCKMYGVSRFTVRDAIAQLADEGFLEKRHGVGTFVKDPKKAKKHGLILLVRQEPKSFGEDTFRYRIDEQRFTEVVQTASQTSIDKQVIHSICVCRDCETLKRGLNNILEMSELQGVILTQNLDYPVKDNMIAMLEHWGLNYCSVDDADRPIHKKSISIDPEPGSLEALEDLWSLGHRRIAFTGKPVHDYGPCIGNETGQYASFHKFCKNRNIDHTPLTVSTQWSYNSIYHGIKEILTCASRPTALFCQSFGRALVALEICRETGIKVPEQLSIIASDNVMEAEATPPPLNCIDFLVGQRTRIAFEYLLGEIPETDMPIRVPSAYIRRNSTASAT